MQVNISYMETPMDFQMSKWENSKLKDNMFLTAKPLYSSIKIEFEKLIDIVKSDYRQYSPFVFVNRTKKSENWSNNNQDLIILDVDDGLTINEAKKIFKDYQYLIATTKSHQVEKKGLTCDRFRIILLSYDVPKNEDYFLFTDMLEKKYPFIDKQVNTKTGAFLGFFKCEYFYNDGKSFNCSEIINAYARLKKATMQEPKQHIAPKKQDYSDSEFPIQEIKSRLTREIVADIVSGCGYNINRKFMFKYRADEKTPSASISPSLLIKDFGSDLSTDAIGFIQETKSVDFKTAVEIVGGYVNVQVA